MLPEYAIRLKELRLARKMSQRQLAAKSGIDTSYIWHLEHGDHKSITIRVAQALAKALGVAPDVFLYSGHGDSPSKLLAALEVAMPVAIPVVAQVHARESAPDEYVYWAKPRAAGRNLRAFRVRGYCMAPEIVEGDTIIVEMGAMPQQGNIVLAYKDHEVLLERWEDHAVDYVVQGVVREMCRDL